MTARPMVVPRMGDQQYAWVSSAEAFGIKAGTWSIATRSGVLVSVISFTPEYKGNGQEFAIILARKALARNATGG